MTKEVHNSTFTFVVCRKRKVVKQLPPSIRNTTGDRSGSANPRMGSIIEVKPNSVNPSPPKCCSTYTSAGASAGEVEAALEGLEPTGDLTVTRSMNSENGYDWEVRAHTQDSIVPSCHSHVRNLFVTTAFFISLDHLVRTCRPQIS